MHHDADTRGGAWSSAIFEYGLRCGLVQSIRATYLGSTPATLGCSRTSRSLTTILGDGASNIIFSRSTTPSQFLATHPAATASPHPATMHPGPSVTHRSACGRCIQGHQQPIPRSLSPVIDLPSQSRLSHLEPVVVRQLRFHPMLFGLRRLRLGVFFVYVE